MVIKGAARANLAFAEVGHEVTVVAETKEVSVVAQRIDCQRGTLTSLLIPIIKRSRRWEGVSARKGLW